MTAIFVIACAAPKQDVETTAREMYTSDNFAHFLKAAEAEAAATARDMGIDAKVMILSAKYGLLDLDDVIAPYNTIMTAKDSIDVRALAASVINKGVRYEDEVYAMLPKAYLERLTAAARLADDIEVQDIWDAAGPGVGYQRGIASSVTRGAALEMVA